MFCLVFIRVFLVLISFIFLNLAQADSVIARTSPFDFPADLPADLPAGSPVNLSSAPSVKNSGSSGDLIFEIIRLKNTQARKVFDLIKQDPALICQGGGLGFDERTNILLLTDCPENLLDIKKLINLIDIPVAQILIEARIVEVDKSALSELGVTQGVGSSGEVLPNMVIGNNNNLKSGVALGAMGSESNGLVNPSGVLGLTLQKLPGGLILDLQLQALETEGQAKVISAPKLTVLNNQEAVIQQGSEVPYLSAALNGATQVQFKKAVLSLRVRPEVTADHEILMSLQVNKDKVSTITANAQGTPVIDTREINTVVKVRSGETLVLGGIEESLDAQSQKGLPGLDKLPGIGWLFRTNSHKHQESEMLIFITPVIE